jgi:hypothetical protein
METVLCDCPVCNAYFTGVPLTAAEQSAVDAERERNEREYRAWLDACREGADATDIIR